MSVKGTWNRNKGEAHKKAEETLERVRQRNDYYCNDCDYEFKCYEADYGLHGTGSHVTEMMKCPKCGTFELTEL